MYCTQNKSFHQHRIVNRFILKEKSKNEIFKKIQWLYYNEEMIYTKDLTDR